MPRGENLDRTHQVNAGKRPRAGRIGAKGAPKEVIEELATQFGESLDAATLRLQIAKANTQELEETKRRQDLEVARGLLVSKADAVDLAQACLLRAATVFDMLPERLRDRLDPSLHHVCDLVDDIIRECRQEVANID